MMKINISKLDRPEQHGDWHDKPLRWAVNGPGSEMQKFSTKEDAKKYRSIRRRACPDCIRMAWARLTKPTKGATK